MKGFYTILGIIAIIAALNNCGNNSTRDQETQMENQDIATSDECVVEPMPDSTAGIVIVDPDPVPRSNGISLATGTQPYDNEVNASGDSAEIHITTESGDTDYVVIVKRNGRIAKNAYINGGDSYTFSVASGTYQVFFYSGEGWDSSKQMAGGHTGGFLAYESFQKDEPTMIDNQTLTYELRPSLNGNFNPEGSSEQEMF